MKKVIGLIVFLSVLSCSNKNTSTTKSVDEYRKEASAADQEACRLDDIRSKVDTELLDMDSIYYYSGEKPELKIKRDSLQHIIDSLDMLIKKQCKIMNKAQHDCDSIHHTWAI